MPEVTSIISVFSEFVDALNICPVIVLLQLLLIYQDRIEECGIKEGEVCPFFENRH